jgi:hypothetical protein
LVKELLSKFQLAAPLLKELFLCTMRVNKTKLYLFQMTGIQSTWYLLSSTPLEWKQHLREFSFQQVMWIEKRRKAA